MHTKGLSRAIAAAPGDGRGHSQSTSIDPDRNLFGDERCAGTMTPLSQTKAVAPHAPVGSAPPIFSHPARDAAYSVAERINGFGRHVES